MPRATKAAIPVAGLGAGQRLLHDWKPHDYGRKLGYLKAFVDYGMRHNPEGEAFSEWVKSL